MRVGTAIRNLLRARMAAVADAQAAMARRELGAGYALRQSLVDLAAIAELLAGNLPAPTSRNGTP